jgi:hypothetical protein
MARTGKTTGNLKLRSAPSMEAEPPIGYLEPDTELVILGEEGEHWLHVRVQGKEGYVGRKYVAIQAAPETGSAPGGMTKRDDLPRPAGPSGLKAHKGVEEE